MASARSPSNRAAGFCSASACRTCPSVEGVRGHTYGKPVATMRAYLEGDARSALSGARRRPRRRRPSSPRIGPAHAGAVGELADGAHPYNSTPGTPPRRAGSSAPANACARSLGLARNRSGEGAPRGARRRCPTTCGSTITSTTGAGRALATPISPAAAPTALSTPIVAWGDEAAIRTRIQQHWDAGADHVCIQSISPRRLAPARRRSPGSCWRRSRRP